MGNSSLVIAEAPKHGPYQGILFALLARINQGSFQFLGPLFLLLAAIEVCAPFPFPILKLYKSYSIV